MKTLIYDKLLGKLTNEEDEMMFHIKKDPKKGNVSNILTIVFPLNCLDEVLNFLGNIYVLINKKLYLYTR